MIDQPQEGVLDRCPGTVELATFPTSASGGNKYDGNIARVCVPRQRSSGDRDVSGNVEYVAAITVLSTAFEADHFRNGISQGDELFFLAAGGFSVVAARRLVPCSYPR